LQHVERCSIERSIAGPFYDARRQYMPDPVEDEGHHERDILSKNDAFAATNRTRLQNAGVFALNLVSSPGSGRN
jgi:hypothetical protein